MATNKPSEETSVSLVDFREITPDGEDWELFARDFLTELGFYVEAVPDRGADLGKDLLVVERLRGHLSSYPFRWLVSAKHFAKSGRAVSEADEPNIQERLDSFRADGFIGFYSTICTAGLNSRLTLLKQNTKVRDYRIFDRRLIENHLSTKGFSDLLIRYLPNSYRRIKPTQLITSEYLPLPCAVCDKDILEELGSGKYRAVIVRATDSEDDFSVYRATYVACKGKCDKEMEERLWTKHRWITSWTDISDLVIPVYYLKHLLSMTNQLNSGNKKWDADVLEKYNHYLISLAQKNLREMTAEEWKRTATLIDLEHIGL